MREQFSVSKKFRHDLEFVFINNISGAGGLNDMNRDIVVFEYFDQLLHHRKVLGCCTLKPLNCPLFLPIVRKL